MHGPSLKDCQACHVQGNPEEHKFFYVVPKDELCQRCHQLPHPGGAGVMHKPVREGKCLECHDPHGSENRRMLVADPKRDLCLKCHQNEIGTFKFVHGPVAVGACIVCHQPHSSEQPKLLVQDPRSLCLTCHSEVVAAASSGQSGVHMHGALEQGCTRCHSPHASDHKFQLHKAAPELCMQCHQDKFSQMIGTSKVVHGAVTQEGGCSVCHEPHSSKLPSLQRNTQPKICLDCHNKPLKTPEGVTLTNMAELLAKNPDHHGPIREGLCTACHNPHAGDHFRMLVEEYPPQFYAPFDLGTFKLCFKCHIPDLVLKASGRGLTQFRDGDRNLHWVHVNQEKGRTCRACHEVHASTRPSHIRDAVPFGTTGWMLEINYQKLPDGGSCAPGCHKPRSYGRTGGTPAASTPSPAATGATP
jgi:predicted CXXCH cytochrome family protein